MIYTKAYFLLLACFWLIGHRAIAQEQKIADSLTSIYKQDTVTGIAKFELLTDLSFHEVRDLEKGLLYAEELIRLSIQAGNSKYLRVGYFLKGTKKRLLGDLEEALKAYFKSAVIARKMKNVTGEGEAFGAIADIYAVASHYDNAMSYYRKAIKVLQGPGVDSISLASVLSNAGDAYLNTGHYDSALYFFGEAKEIFKEVDYRSGIGYSLGNIGMAYANIGKDVLAEKNINEAIRILTQAQDYYPICVYLISMADVYSKNGNEQKAFDYTLRSFELAKQHGFKEQIRDASQKLSQLYEKRGNTEVALMYYKTYDTYSDSIQNIKKIQEMADARTNFEVSQKQMEVNLLKDQKRNQQTIVVFLFIILGLTVMLLVAVFWFFKTKTKERVRLHNQELLHAKLEIQEQTYRNISQELHDNIGQVLSLAKLNINTVDVENVQSTKEKLAQSKSLITKAIQDIRDLARALNTDYIHDVGLANAIDQQLELLRKTGLYTTKLIVNGDVYPIEPERELLLYRIVQELLNNIVKHADANQIVISINYEKNIMVFTMADNGKGFDWQKQQLNVSNGLGLRNITNRVKLVKGDIFFESKSDIGTVVHISIQR